MNQCRAKVFRGSESKYCETNSNYKVLSFKVDI